MNSLIVFADEGWRSGRIVIQGERGKEASRYYSNRLGHDVKVALFGGDRGMARISSLSHGRVELDLLSAEPSLPLRPIDLIVGLSRPQTVKKVIQVAVMAGVRSLHLVHSESGEESYIDSHILRPEQLRNEVVKSLEQIWQGHHPCIQAHRTFAYFMRNHLPRIADFSEARKIIAHPGSSLRDLGGKNEGRKALVIAIGSEGGWSEAEVNSFEMQAFERTGLGPRVVRVEIALTYLLGQSLSIY